MPPQRGDVLVSRSSGSLEHRVSIVPSDEHERFQTHAQAVARACALAADKQVDAWLTEDLTHFIRLAGHRQ